MSTRTNLPLLIVPLVLATITAIAVVGCDAAATNPPATTAGVAPVASAGDALASLEGGAPLPDGVLTLSFPAMASKQAISFISDGIERILGTIAVGGDAPIGTAEIGGDHGVAHGGITVRVDQMRTGDSTRDGHLRGAGWLDAEAHPEIVFTLETAERVRPTVWKIVGTWQMHGVTKPVEFHANIRHYPDFPHLGNVARIEASFTIALADYGIENASVGVAVEPIWTIELVLLGQIQEN